jgi:hypothetical protein
VSLIFAGFCVGVVCHLGWTTVRDATTARVVEPVITAQVVRDYAAGNGVCVRPLLRQATDRETGGVERLVIPCGSTREAVAPPARRKHVGGACSSARRGGTSTRTHSKPARTMTARTAWSMTRTPSLSRWQSLSLVGSGRLDGARTSRSCHAHRRRTGRWAGPSRHRMRRHTGPRCS